MRQAAPALVLLAACRVVAIHVETPATLAGDTAPAFALPSSDGGTVGLDGQPTLLVFYRGFW
jgi:hypothetical protein